MNYLRNESVIYQIVGRNKRYFLKGSYGKPLFYGILYKNHTKNMAFKDIQGTPLQTCIIPYSIADTTMKER